MFATAESIARRGAIDSNQLLWMGNQQGNIGPDGDLYSRKGLGMTLLAVPLVWPALLWAQLGLVHTALLLVPFATAATGALVYRAGVRLGWPRATAAATAVGFGLATMAWPYTQEFFSDPICALGLFGAFYGLLAFGQTGRKGYLVSGAIAWGVAYLTRSVNLVTLPLYLVELWLVLVARQRIERAWEAQRPWLAGGEAVEDGAEDGAAGWRAVLAQQWRPMVSFLLPVVVAGLLSLWWNWARFGSIWESGYVESERFSAPWLFGLFGLTVGPARGLLWYNPLLLLALPGALWFWRHSRRTLLFIAALSVLYIGLYAKWYMWHGGYSWGPRFLVPLLPFLTLLCGPAWERLVLRRRWGWAGAAAALLLGLLSIGVQWLGMAVPFGLVQERLAAEVQPLFAPETFTQLRYSPLRLQWEYLRPEHLHFAWWRGGDAGLPWWQQIDWPALIMPLAAFLLGLLILVRQTHPPREHEWRGAAPRNYLYVGALLLLAPAMLIDQMQHARGEEIALMAQRIHAGERRADDAILHLVPEETQALANVYHGRLGTFGLPGATREADARARITQIAASGRARLWVLPDATPPEASAWEALLRRDHYLLAESRPAGPEGRRLALYALADAYALGETGLGTLFGDPSPNAPPVSAATGWIRLAGYRLTQETAPGGEILLALRWEALQPVAADYQVFVHLLDGNGTRIAQRDGQPVQWMRPTSTWQAGEQITDRYGILLPDDLPPGLYTLLVGLYDPVTGQRLAVSAGPGDYAIELGPVHVAP